METSEEAVAVIPIRDAIESDQGAIEEVEFK